MITNTILGPPYYNYSMIGPYPDLIIKRTILRSLRIRVFLFLELSILIWVWMRKHVCMYIYIYIYIYIYTQNYT